MKLADLLVSYKQVTIPKTVTPVEDTPINKYQRMLEYLNSKSTKNNDSKKEDKKENTEETTVQEPTQDFIGWDYSSLSTERSPQSSTSSKLSTSTVSPQSQNQWVSDLTAAYKRQGLSDNAIKNLITKNSIESNWGRAAQGTYNYGNITTGSNWRGKYVDGKDKNANGNTISNRFRSYDSIDDFVKDEIQFLTRLYDFNPNDDIDTFLNKLQGNNSGKRHYAEARDYKQILKNHYNRMYGQGNS